MFFVCNRDAPSPSDCSVPNNDDSLCGNPSIHLPISFFPTSPFLRIPQLHLNSLLVFLLDSPFARPLLVEDMAPNDHREEALIRAPISPMPLQLPSDSQDNFGFSQQPLCTPVDQVAVEDVDPPVPPSPCRKTNKRRRVLARNTSIRAPAFAKPDPFNPDPTLSTSCALNENSNADRPVLDLHVTSSFPDDDSVQFNSQSYSQKDLPQLSQETLSLFPTIIKTHQLNRPPLSPLFASDGLMSDAVGATAAVRGFKGLPPSSASTGVARACFASALAKSFPLTNPFLPDSEKPAFRPTSDARANASESFQNMDSLLTSREDPPLALRDDSLLAPHEDSSLAPPIDNAIDVSAHPPRVDLPPAANASRYKADHARKNKHKDQQSILKLIVAASLGQRPKSQNFYILGLAGRGAFSEVLRAVHRVDGCTYAIKKNITPFVNGVKRHEGLHEVFTLASLQGHPNILRYFDSWLEDRGKFVYLQTEFLPQGNIQKLYVDRKEPMPTEELLFFIEDVASALEFMHSRNIAHVDIKPDNIFRTDRGSLGRSSFVVGDFGLACDRYGRNASNTEGDSRYLCPEALGSIVGTSPATTATAREDSDNVLPSDDDDVNDDEGMAISSLFDSKRQASRTLDRDLCIGDVFSFGASIYELSMGIPLERSGPGWTFVRTKTAEVAQQVEEKCHSRFIADVVRKCLEPDPTLRTTAANVKRMCVQRRQNHQTAREFAEITRLRAEMAKDKERLKQFEVVMEALLAKGEEGRQQYRNRQARKRAFCSRVQ